MRSTAAPRALLNWLETQLGLTSPEVPKANRITELLNSLDGVADAVFAKSLATDRWATSSELLSRQDQLRIAGWKGDADESLPKLVRDLARATERKPLLFADESTRLQKVQQALADGQKLPAQSMCS